MRLLRTVLAGILLLSATYAHSQSADEIVGRYINAIGGRKVIDNIKSQVINSTISVMGSDLPSKTILLVGKGFKSEANFNGQDIIQAITPTSGWMINPLQGMTDAQPLPAEQVQAAQPALYIIGEFQNYPQNGVKLEFAGQETVDGVNAYKVKMTRDGKESYFFFDSNTYYLLKHETRNTIDGQEVVATALFSNYQKTDFGLVVPHTTIRNQGFEMTINVSSVQFNVEIDPKIFEIPK